MFRWQLSEQPCFQTERQLSQTLREREQWRESASKAQQDFDSEVKSASVELDHWRSEAQELASSIEELDEQKKEIPNSGKCIS
eukprot:s379_g2.t1